MTEDHTLGLKADLPQPNETEPNKGHPAVLDRIITRVYTRREKWNTEVVYSLPKAFDLTEAAIIGSFSVCLLSSRQRILSNRALLSVNGTHDTATTLARDYLTVKFGVGGRISKDQGVAVSEVNPNPLYAKPARYEHGFYIDIRSAYWSIMRVVGWQVDYFPQKWLMRGRGVRDFPWQKPTRTQKLARNALVSACSVHPMTLWSPNDRKFYEVNKGNPLINKQLLSLVSDVLNAIAAETIAAGAVYVATDGYIAPDYGSATKVLQVVEDWGLTPVVKAEGSGMVSGPGSYKVGNKRTKVFGRYRDKRSYGKTVKEVYKVPHHSWLRSRFSKLAAFADHED